MGYLHQKTDPFEIIVADDGSDEGTKKIIKKYSEISKNYNILKLHHIWQPDDGFRKCKILNTAIEQATGEYIIFTDGDCIPHPNFVNTHREFAEHGRFLSGGYFKLPMKTSKAVTLEDVATGKAFSLRYLRTIGLKFNVKTLKLAGLKIGINRFLDRITPAKKTFNGNNSSCWRKDALMVRGFDERMGYGGEDREFGYRLQNLGISPKVIRYSTICLHLDHERAYKNPDIREKNLEIIKTTRSTGLKKTEHGIKI
jgi:glycosyltransferase involved in cell wall biosynthesis